MARITPEKVLTILQRDHTGSDNGVHIKRLAREVLAYGGQPTAQFALTDNSAAERTIRLAVAVLREQGHPICAHPNNGYFYAANSGEINATCEFLYARAMHSLRQISALNKKALPELRGQLGLDMEQSNES